MEETSGQEENGLFDDLLPAKREKGILYNAVSVSSIIYIIFFLVGLVFDVRTFSLKEFRWQFALIFLSPPLLALFLHLTSRKIGWYIGYFYYGGMSILGIFSILHGFPNLRGIILMLLDINATVLLLLKPIRKYFSVRTQTVTVTSIIVIVTGIVLIISLL